MDEKLISNFLKIFPLPLAIPRINEALSLSKYKFVNPILDIGCGDGKFTKLLLGSKYDVVGFDMDDKELLKAKKEGFYREVVSGFAYNLPFESKEFETILVNSVLEHVGDLNEVLRECFRVLKSKGSIFLTVPTPLVSDYLFWSKFIPGYADFKRRLWQHINYFSANEWEKRLVNVGFKIKKIEMTNSKEAIKWGDILFLTFVLGPLPFFKNFLRNRKIFGPDKNGATLVIQATKS